MRKIFNIFIIFFGLIMVVVSAEPEMKLWDFKSGLQGWLPANWDNYKITEYGFSGISGKDCQLISPPLNIIASDYDLLLVGIKTNKSFNGEVFLAGNGQKFSELTKTMFRLASSDRFRLFKIPLTAKRGWSGKIEKIRLDPSNFVGADISIAFIALAKSSGNLLNNSDAEFQVNNDALYWNMGNGASVVKGDAASMEKFFKLPKAGSFISYNAIDTSFLGVQQLEGMSKGKPVQITFIYRNLHNKEISSKNFYTSESGNWNKFNFKLDIPAQAASVDLQISAISGSAAVDNLKFCNITKGVTKTVKTGKLNWKAFWIWDKDKIQKDHCTVWFKKDFIAPEKPWKSAKIQITCDDSFTLFINNKEVACTDGIIDGWRNPVIKDIQSYIVPGANTILVKAKDVTGAEGLITELYINAAEKLHLLTGTDWKAASDKNGPWSPAYIIGQPPCTPWQFLEYEAMGDLPVIEAALSFIPKSVKIGDSVNISPVISKYYGKEKIGIRARLFQSGEMLNEVWARNGVSISENGIINSDKINLHIYSSANPGKALLKVDFPGAQLDCKTLDVEIEIVPGTVKKSGNFPESRVVMINGVANIKVNGDILNPTQILFSRPDELQQSFSKDADIHFWGTLMELGFYEHGFDYSKIDNILEQYFLVNPNAYMALNVTLDPGFNNCYQWWLDKHPEARCRLENGSDIIGAYLGAKQYLVSYGSQLWREVFADALRRLIQHLKQTPYAERIIAIHPTFGVSTEWFHWGSQSNELVDYSECGQEDFRRWLLKKYGSNEKLQKAWNNSSVTLKNATVPSGTRRITPEKGMFYDPVRQRDVLDYNDYQHEIVIDTISYFAKVVKEETNGNCLFGTYYGYTMHLMEIPFFGQSSGHFRLEKLLESPYIDYAMAPVAYSWRQVGGSTATMVCPWSFNLNGKLFWNQADLRTHWLAKSEYGAPQTVQGSAQIMRRELARNLAEGNAIQWYDFSIGYYTGDKRLMDEAKSLYEITSKVRNSIEDWAPENYLLVVVDEKVMGNYDINHPAYGGAAVANLRNQLALSGIPWRAVLLSDLMKHKELLKYCAMLFPNAMLLNDEQIEYFRKHILTDGRFVAFSGPVGILSKSGLNSECASKLLGFDLKIENEPVKLIAKATSKWPELNGKKWGTVESMSFAPILLPDKIANTSVIAVLSDSQQPAVLYNEQKNCKILWSAVPGFPPEMLRAIAIRAGIPIVSETNDPLYAGCGYVGIHAGSAGEKSLQLLKKGKPRDLLSGRSWPEDSKKIKFRMEVGDTMIIVVD
jgi:hypothetical protein